MTQPKRNLVSNFKPYGMFISKSLFATGLTNFKRDNLRTFTESPLRISRSSLFHPVIAEKKEFLKKITSGFDIGYVVNLSASSGIKLRTVWN